MLSIPTKYIEIVVLRIFVSIHGIEHEHFMLSTADNIFHLVSPGA